MYKVQRTMYKVQFINLRYTIYLPIEPFGYFFWSLLTMAMR